MTGPAREQSATKARPPRLSLAGSAARSPQSPNQEGSSQSCATTRAGFRGASRPLREAGDPPAGRTHQPQLARSSPTWSELRPRSTRRCLSPLGTLQPLAFGAGAQSSAHRRDRPATPSSQLRSAQGLGRGRGSRREARGTRRAGRARTRRGRAQTLERAWPGRGAKGAGTESSFCFLFLSGFLLKKKNMNSRQFRFLVGVAPGRRFILLSSAQVVRPVSFWYRISLRRHNRGSELEDPRAPLGFNIVEC